MDDTNTETTEGRKELPSSANKQKRSRSLDANRNSPAKVCEAIDETVDEDAEIFLSRVENKMLDFFNENANTNRIDERQSLNCDHDTEEELEAVTRFFPELLSHGDLDLDFSDYEFDEEVVWDAVGCPILWQSGTTNGEHNRKTVSFIPLLAELGVELDRFEEEG